MFFYRGLEDMTPEALRAGVEFCLKSFHQVCKLP